MTQTPNTAPKGQFWIDAMPRFGLPMFVDRFVDNAPMEIDVVGDAGISFTLTAQDLARVPNVQTTTDFHCVTTWSVAGLEWQGFSFADIYNHLIAPKAEPAPSVAYVCVYAHDGYRAMFQIEDILNGTVLIATHLNGAPLDDLTGGPYRLVSPTQYGYKSVKFVKRIEVRTTLDTYKSPAFSFMEHPRARVDLEERARGIPGWLVRWPNRLMIKSTVRNFAKAWRDHKTDIAKM